MKKRAFPIILAISALALPACSKAAAILTTTVYSSPQLASTGHTVKVIAEVMNIGDADARNVAPCDGLAAGCPVPSCVAVAETSPGSVALLSGPSPSCTVYLAVNARTSFTWQYQLNSAGQVWFTVTFTGQQIAVPDTVTASDTVSLTILNAASLSATMAVEPACPPDCSLDYRQTVTFRLDVTNTGQVGASSVCPAALSSQGPGGFTILSTPSCIASLGAGASHSFTWSAMATSAGTVTVYSSASGVDEFGGETLALSSNCSSVFLDVIAPSILSMTLTGSQILMRGEESEFRILATNISSTVLCQSSFILSLDGFPDLSLVSVLPVFPRCYTPGQTREFLLKARLSKDAPGGARLVTATAVGTEQYSGVPLLSEGGTMPVVVFEGAPGIAEISHNPYRVLQDGKLRIRYFIGEDQAGQKVSLKLYSLAGELVKTLVDEPRGAGGWEVLWDGRNAKGQTIASGVYIIMFEARFCKGLRKLAVIK